MLALLVLLVLNLAGAVAQTSLLNARQIRFLSLDHEKDVRVGRTLGLMRDLARVRVSLSLVRMLFRFLLAALIVAPSLALASINLQLLGVLALIGLGIWFSEFLAEWLVLRNPETWAARLSGYAWAIVTLLRPLTGALMALFRFPAVGPEQTGILTEDELKTLVEAGQREGVLEQDEREMIISIFRFGDTLAREIMVPRIDVLALHVRTPLPEAVDALLESGFSRVPVYEGNIDNILGLLYAKDLLRVWREGNHVDSLRSLLRPAYFTPATKKVSDLLTEMQAQRIHMAIVVDEYGGTAGLVTLEDIVEEIIGEVQDEYDQAEEQLYQQIGDGEYIFHGRIDLDDFDAILHTHLAESEADTLGGFIYSQMGRVPKGGESLQVENLILTVEQVVRRRIRRVRVRRVPQSIQPEESEEEEASHADE